MAVTISLKNENSLHKEKKSVSSPQFVSFILFYEGQSEFYAM